MRPLSFILNVLVLPALVLVSCAREPLVGEDAVELCIRINLPSFNFTKAEGEVSPSDAEAYINDLRIWVYRHSDAKLLGYINPAQGTHRQGEWEDRYFLRFTTADDIAIIREQPEVDVYVLANCSAAGLNPGASATRASLDALLISGTYYGLNDDHTPAHLGTPDSKGLLFSAVGRGLTMGGNFPSMTVPTVTLKRCMSKFRFVVCQLSDAVGPVREFTLDYLSLDGGQIPVSESVFNISGNPWRISADYLAAPVEFSPPAWENIAWNESPQDYAYPLAGVSGEAYEQLIQKGIDEGVLTDIGTAYLRESNMALSGTIKYTMKGEKQQTRSFSMDAAGGFSRNHSWTVYIYFLRDQMEFTVSWTPWEQGQDFTVTK